MSERTWGANWAAAMVKFQKSAPVIAKDRTVKMDPTGRGGYSYSYAPYEEIVEKCKPVLAD